MLRIIVCLKQVVEVTEIKTDPTTQSLITAGTPRKISDFDMNALEEAVRIKERIGGEVIALTVSFEDARTSLRKALAIGADRVYLVSDSFLQDADTLVTSYILAEAIEKIGRFDLIICGEAAIDSYSAQVGPRLAERLEVPIITYARNLTVDGDGVVAERNMEDCFETVKAKMPVLVTVTKEINEPRLASFMAVMKASKKELVVWSIGDLGASKERIGNVSSAVQILDISAPKVERRRVRIEGKSVQEIAEKLAEALIREGVVGK